MPGNPPVPRLQSFAELVDAGDIGQWGVSNLDISDMTELLDAGGNACATNQILYNLTRRGPEYDLLLSGRGPMPGGDPPPTGPQPLEML
ncbi:hypothetical protein O7626_18515 [Micromonospora sp. WMMD1102]|uniref:aldo/keto reductase n=1 Tax=Micromonospora sp. WMMD1102 TaxID=3016105 RepID=UPI002415923E|nr:aldo/keto reductase [Micromonospora sp. WMMD1102]MDG4787909.1 hypothetical protein [Micromonospora sp. WMMD1102]